VLRAATADLSWLLSRAYAMTSSLKLVGDRYALTERQRIAVARASCTDQAQTERAQRAVAWESLQGEEVLVDGFNLLITIEAALGGGLILSCRDGCLRDLASMHGSYRAVQETEPALDLIGAAFESVNLHSVHWLFDRPVSNSGRLAQTLRALAERRGWPWEAELVFNPDAMLRGSEKIVISSDAVVLDAAPRWVNAAAYLVQGAVPTAWLVDLCA
jgi:hypothetical protein